MSSQLLLRLCRMTAVLLVVLAIGVQLAAAQTQPPQPSDPVFKLTPGGTCYAPGDQNYELVVLFHPFPTLSSCEEGKPQCSISDEESTREHHDSRQTVRRLAYFGCLSSLTALLDSGASVNADDPAPYDQDSIWRANPLDLAVMGHRAEVAQLLRSRGGRTVLTAGELRETASRLRLAVDYDGSITSLPGHASVKSAKYSSNESASESSQDLIVGHWRALPFNTVQYRSCHRACRRSLRDS